MTAVSQAIKDNPRQSSGNCQKLSIRSMTYQDLDMKSKSVQSRPRFTEEVRLRHLEGSQLLLNFMKILRTTNLGDVASPVARSQSVRLKAAVHWVRVSAFSAEFNISGYGHALTGRATRCERDERAMIRLQRKNLCPYGSTDSAKTR